MYHNSNFNILTISWDWAKCSVQVKEITLQLTKPVWLPAFSSKFLLWLQENTSLYWLLKPTWFTKHLHWVSNELPSDAPSCFHLKMWSGTCLKEESKAQSIFASRMLSRWLVVEMVEPKSVFFFYFLKRSITVHRYSLFFLTFLFIPVFTESAPFRVVDLGPSVAITG